jgi:hypothetical protein
MIDVRRLNFDESLREGLEQPSLKQWLEKRYLKDRSERTIYFTLIQYKVKDPEKPENEWEWEEFSVLWSVSLAFLDQKSSIIAPKMGIALLTVPAQDRKKNEEIKNNTVLSGYSRLNDNDFSPIQPFSTETSVKVEWIRVAGLKTLDRIDTNHLGTPSYDYDAVVYGSGGELIPIEDKQVSES